MQPNELFIGGNTVIKKTRPLKKAAQKNEPCVKKPLKGSLKGKAKDFPIENIQDEGIPCDKKIFEEPSTLLTLQEDTSMEEEAQLLVLETNEFKIIYRDLKYFLRRLVARILPARAPQDYDKVDPVTNLHIRVKSSPCYVTFSVNERDFYWDRWSGKFDGTGSSFIYEHPSKSDVEPIKVNLPFENVKDACNPHD